MKDQRPRAQRICAGCGMVLTSHGYLLADETFCCQGCAEETGCDCEQQSLISRKAPPVVRIPYDAHH